MLTAIGNDYSFDPRFCSPGPGSRPARRRPLRDSTSGRSKNVVLALEVAKSQGIITVGLTGRDPRDMGSADYVLAMPSTETGKIQELQLVAGHIIFALVERTLFPIEVEEPVVRAR